LEYVKSWIVLEVASGPLKRLTARTSNPGSLAVIDFFWQGRQVSNPQPTDLELNDGSLWKFTKSRDA
jgi:hypothetical protein